ncbi:MAG: hypothetical protein GQ552_08635 [Flavobacteriaceae bacterium]|nr:hypothetical protein [Flavobacteriaceae bacterium]
MKFKLRILTILSLFLTALCFQPISAQDNNKRVIDSLYVIVNSINYSDINKVDSYLELTKIFLHKNIDSANVYAEKGKLLAKKNSDTKLVVKFLIQLARINEVQNDIIGSIAHLNEAAKLYEGLDKDYIYMTVCNYQGMYFDILSNYDMSIEKYLLGLRLANAQNHREYEAVFLINLSLVYAKVNEFEKSLSSILESATIYNEIGPRAQYFQSLIWVGSSYIYLKKYDLAKTFLFKSKNYFEKLDDHILLAEIYTELGKISMINENMEEALELLLIAQYHALEMKDYNAEQNYNLALINNTLGNIYLYFQNYSQAIQLFRMSLNIGINIKTNEVLKGAYKGLYSSYLALNKMDSISHYLDLFISVNDSLIAEKYNEKIDALNYDYQLDREKKRFNKESELLKLDIKRQKLTNLLILSFLSLIILTGTFLWYVQRNRLKKSTLVGQNLKLEKENLANALERKNKELTSSVLHLIERNEFISEISDKLENINSQEATIDLKEINNIIRNIDKNINKKLWKQFELRYVEVHNDSFQKLTKICPKLTSNDRRLCALIMLNMSTKDISSITYQSVQSIKIARYRLRKKLSLAKNENLTFFLNNL